MKYPFDDGAPSLDANALGQKSSQTMTQKINQTIQRAFTAAGLDTSAGPMPGVTETIRRAMAAAGLGEVGARFDRDAVIEVAARVVPVGDVGDAVPARQPSIVDLPAGPGSFETHEFSNEAGTRAYKVYVPAVKPAAPCPMMVMLHGCTQSADDFAAGTRMNQLADEQGFVVVYPEQASQANPSRCWNWFKPQDQARGSGEPALIAGIVREVAQRHAADPRRIFVAGLSAGAAMAVVLGRTYPELFAGVGAHSGLPYGSAHDVASALAAMKGGRSNGLKTAPHAAATGAGQAMQAVPVIVFHGDRDHTVQHTNGAQIVLQAEQAHAAEVGDGLQVSTQSGVASGGRRFSRVVHADADGQVRIESWTVHGAGHAWSGGHASGSYTDGTGPDASAEMVRFFLALPRSGSA